MLEFRKAALAVAMSGLFIAGSQGLVACDEEGPAEQAGEAVDETASDMQRAGEDAAD